MQDRGVSPPGPPPAPRPAAGRPRPELFLCMGSACHQRGVYDVLPLLQALLRDSGLADAVELKGAFCLDRCAEGITLRCGEAVFTRLGPDNLAARFGGEVRPCLEAARAARAGGHGKEAGGGR